MTDVPFKITRRTFFPDPVVIVGDMFGVLPDGSLKPTEGYLSGPFDGPLGSPHMHLTNIDDCVALIEVTCVYSRDAHGAEVEYRETYFSVAREKKMFELLLQFGSALDINLPRGPNRLTKIQLFEQTYALIAEIEGNKT
jgi:hypothetical protein